MAFGGQMQVDHLVYGVPDLAAGIDDVERLAGVRAAHGGPHPGRGTHNALLSLGTGTYLEIIAPDPDQPHPRAPRPFGLDTLHEPRLVTWAVRSHDIERQVEAARAAGYDPGIIAPMSRRPPGGDGELHWRLTARPTPAGDGVVPFLIQWEPGRHPSAGAPTGAGLIDLEAEHPHADEVRAMLDALGISIPVTEAARPALLATIECPNGTVVLT